MPRYTGINHLVFATPDIQETIRFWRDLLGLRLLLGMGRPGMRHYFFQVSATDMIAFFEWSDVERIPERDHGVPVKGPFGFDHVSLDTPSLDDLWELYDTLDAAGFWVSEIIDHGFIHSLYAFDPNNIPIEFSCPSEVDIRAEPRMLDRDPPPAALEGPDPVPGIWPTVTSPTPEEERWTYPGETLSQLKQDKDI